MDVVFDLLANKATGQKIEIRSKCLLRKYAFEYVPSEFNILSKAYLYSYLPCQLLCERKLDSSLREYNDELRLKKDKKKREMKFKSGKARSLK